MADTWKSALGLSFRDTAGHPVTSFPFTTISPYIWLDASQIAMLATSSQSITEVRGSASVTPPSAVVGQAYGFYSASTSAEFPLQTGTLVSGSNNMTMSASAFVQGRSVLFGSSVQTGSNYVFNITQLDFLVHDNVPPEPPISNNTSFNSVNSFAPMPQSQAVDLTTGYPTIEWYRYWTNPNFQSFSFSGVIGVANGGTGLSTGNSGGVLAFTDAATLESSPTLGQYEIVLGGGTGAPPSTPLGTGDVNLVLHGNPTGAPSWGKVNLNTDTTGQIGVNQGGTGLSSGITGGLLYFQNPYQMASLAPGNANWVLITNASGLPAWAVNQPDLATLWVMT